MPDIDTDQSVFTFWEDSLNAHEQCDADESCENEIQWFVKCGVCQMAEVVCDIHMADIKQVMDSDPRFTFVFNHTCGHTVLARKCKIEHM